MVTITQRNANSWSIASCEFGWWLTIILVRIMYFIYLVILTIEDSGFGSELRYGLNLSISEQLCRAGLLIAGALWLWSHMELFLVCQFVRLIALTILDLQFGPHDDSEKGSITFGDDNFLFYWNIYLGARLIAGVLWLWSHKKLVFLDGICIFIFIIYTIISLFYEDNYGESPAAQRDDPVPSHDEEGTDTGCDSDSISIGAAGTWQCYLEAMIGHNVNIGGGTQTIGGVRIKINKCRDIIFRSSRKVRNGIDDAINGKCI